MKESVIVMFSPSPGIMTITLNRPEKSNAMNGEVMHKFIHALKEIAADREIRVVILTGNGTHFCAGADINWMQQIAQGKPEINFADAKELALLLQMLYTFPKPTIALTQGMILGGGMGLTACCDIVIAAENANFGFSEAKIGLTPSVISPYIISAIGARASRYYFLTADKFNAQEAQRIGLVHQIVAEDKLVETGIHIAKKLLKNSPHALTEVKTLISRVANEKITQELVHYTAEHLAGMRATEDAQEGLKAFLEKREAQWK